MAKVDPDFTMPAGFDENDKKTRDKCLYLKQLLADKRNMAQMPGVFNHLERLLDDGKLANIEFQSTDLALPEKCLDLTSDNFKRLVGAHI